MAQPQSKNKFTFPHGSQALHSIRHNKKWYERNGENGKFAAAANSWRKRQHNDHIIVLALCTGDKRRRKTKCINLHLHN